MTTRAILWTIDQLSFLNSPLAHPSLPTLSLDLASKAAYKPLSQPIVITLASLASSTVVKQNPSLFFVSCRFGFPDKSFYGSEAHRR